MTENDVPPAMLNWSSSSIPAFPDGLEEAEIQTLSYSKLCARDSDEIEKLVEACKKSGFFRVNFRDDENGLKFLGVADELFQLAARFYALPLEEKMKDSIFNHGDCMFGYKPMGTTVIDKDGNKDHVEHYHVGVRDVYGYPPSPAHYNPVIQSSFPSPLRAFADYGLAASTLVLELLSRELDLGASNPTFLPKLHSPSANSGTHIRLLKNPANLTPSQVNFQPHTDWGSTTILFNVLGGLQIHSDGDWKWLRPLEGTAIFNLGDAMEKFSGGRLKSSMHRVVSPPGEQGRWARYSLAYFTRPQDQVLLGTLGNAETGGEAEKVTFKEWAMRRAMNNQAKSFKKENWEKGRGTEKA